MPSDIHQIGSPSVLTLWRGRLREARQRGMMPMVRRRFGRMKTRFQMNNFLIGKYVELRGNIVNLHGVKISLDNSVIHTREKSNLYFGHYEGAEVDLVRRWVSPDLPVMEFGASIGVVSCVTNTLLRDRNRHIVVEANPMIVPSLQRNGELNHCGFKIIGAALAYGSEFIDFFVHKYFVQSSIGGRGENEERIQIPTTSFKQLLADSSFDRVTVICDIEGAEISFVKNEIDLLARHADTIIMETHMDVTGKEATLEMLQNLSRAGFRQVDSIEGISVVVLKNNSL